MPINVALIIDSRKELSMQYKINFEQSCSIPVFISVNITETFELMEKLEPDLVLLSDTFSDNTPAVIGQIREKAKEYRPTIIILSKSEDIKYKLAVLDSGADDFLSESIDRSEMCARIYAHMRRQTEILANPITGLPGVKTICKVITRTVKGDFKWALLYIGIDNFESYREIYGDIASNRMLQTYTAIMKSALDSNDFVGQIGDNDFIILTSVQKADKIAIFLNYAFDSVSAKFYTEQDSKRGYIILHGNNKAGRRIPLVTTSIGIVSNEYKNYGDYKETLNDASAVHKLAKDQQGSSWIIDRPQLTGVYKDSCEIEKKILIVENDAALAYLLTTTLDMQGYQTEAISSYSEVFDRLYAYRPDLIVFDAGSEDMQEGFDICRLIKSKIEFANTKIIVSTVLHDKEMVLNTGVDLYLPKPYELVSLFNWVSTFLA
jgi:DNA-binding response OmpR family regulator